MKARLASLENRKKILQAQDVDKPTLRKTQTADSTAGQDGQQPTQQGDDHPTLTRRDDDYAASPGQL